MSKRSRKAEKQTPPPLPAKVVDDDSEANENGAADENGDEGGIAPLSKKVGEGEDNLRRREEWFRKRTGDKA